MEKISIKKSCFICGEDAILRNFGAISCNACAAFFRRSIVLKKSYFCKNDKNCFHKSEKTKRLNCRFCRFTKCIDAGMKAENVRAINFSTNSSLLEQNDDVLSKLVYFRRAAYFNRMQSIMRIVENIDKKDRATFKTMGKVSVAEGMVLYQYLDSTGLFGFVDCDNKFAYLVKIMHLWVQFDMGLATIRNGGLHRNLIYFLDETSREVNEDHLTLFYRSCTNGKNIDTVARTWCDFYHEFMRVLKKIYQYSFDETELALLIQLILLKLAEEFPRKTYNQKYLIDIYKKEIFVALHKYYKNNGRDYSLRLGDLIFVYTELEKIRTFSNELRQLMQLNDIWPSGERTKNEEDIKKESDDLDLL